MFEMFTSAFLSTQVFWDKLLFRQKVFTTFLPKGGNELSKDAESYSRTHEVSVNVRIHHYTEINYRENNLAKPNKISSNFHGNFFL